MFNSKKAQTHILEFVLVLGIAVAGVSAALLWSKPILNKGEAKLRFKNALNSALELYKALSTITESKYATVKFNYNILKVTNNSIYISVSLSNYVRYIKGYWLPLTKDSFGINPVNGTLDVTTSSNKLIVAAFRLTPNQVNFIYYSVLKRDSKSKCEKIVFIPTLSTNGKSITVKLLDIEYTNNPCPVTVVYRVSVS